MQYRWIIFLNYTFENVIYTNVSFRCIGCGVKFKRMRNNMQIRTLHLSYMRTVHD